VEVAGAEDHRRERGPANVAMAEKITASSGFPTNPSHDSGCSLVPVPGTTRIPSARKKLQVLIEKYYTQGNLTESKPSRKSAAA
jgi:hypothetical protein